MVGTAAAGGGAGGVFCQMVDDRSVVPEEFPAEDEVQKNERLRLFALISELVTWENTTNEEVPYATPAVMHS